MDSNPIYVLHHPLNPSKNMNYSKMSIMITMLETLPRKIHYSHMQRKIAISILIIKLWIRRRNWRVIVRLWVWIMRVVERIIGIIISYEQKLKRQCRKWLIYIYSVLILIVFAIYWTMKNDNPDNTINTMDNSEDITQQFLDLLSKHNKRKEAYIA